MISIMRYGTRSVVSSRYEDRTIASSRYEDESVASSGYEDESVGSSGYENDSVASSWCEHDSIASSKNENESIASSCYGNQSVASSRYENHSDVSSYYGNRSVVSKMHDDRSAVSNMASSMASLSMASSYYTAGMQLRQQNKSRLAFQASRALQRRKKESERNIAEQDRSRFREVDYETNATSLYKMIEKKLWSEAVDHCKQEPLEARTWVVRKETGPGGKLRVRWKLLPIHTAIIFRAPIALIKALIEAFPDGPTETDDQKMLPLHLACRIVSTEEIVTTLIESFPEALNQKDRKGRIPTYFLSEKYDRPQISQSKAQQRVNEINRKRLVEVVNKFMKEQGNHSSDNYTNIDSCRFNHNESHSIMSVIKENDDVSMMTADNNWAANNASSKRDCESNEPVNEHQIEEDDIDVSQLAIQNMASDGSKFFASFDVQNSHLSAVDERDETEETNNDEKQGESSSNFTTRSELSDENIGITLDPSAQLRSLMKVMTSSNVPEYTSYPISKGTNLDVESNETKTHTRRVNACGALKTLTKSNNSRIRLVRTKGIISSLCKVLCDPKAVDEERIRCITTLLNLSAPSRNHEIMYGADGLRRSLTKALADPNSIVRYNCCLIVMMLAKSERNRILMCNHRQFMESIINIVYSANDVEKESKKKHDPSKKFCIENVNIKSKSDRENALKSRQIVMKIFLTFSKVKEVAKHMAKNKQVVKILVESSGSMTDEENILCVAVVTNLTRDITNSKDLVSHQNLVDAIVKAVSSELDEERKCAVFALQNLSCCVACRQDLATTFDLLTAIARVAFVKNKPKIQIGALHTLRNLCNEPSNLITITDTPGVSATLLATANDPSHEMAQYLACDALATLSQWLRLSAESCIDKIPKEKLTHNYKMPSLRTTSWNQWE